MLEKPTLADDQIVACIQTAYGLDVAQVDFLPLGADENTAVYRLTSTNNTSYFLKLRSGPFAETLVLLPHFLHNQGIRFIIPPLTTQTGQLWANLEQYMTILYPFVDGQNGYKRPLSDENWRELGTAVRQIQSTSLPPTLTNHIRREAFSPHWRNVLRRALAEWITADYADPIARNCAVFLQSKRPRLVKLVEDAEQLAHILQAEKLPFTLCHADLHAGNVLLTDQELYIVDWDSPILAPKERDLMFAGAGLFGHGRSPANEELLFYQGYGRPTEINHTAVTYYRTERIMEDIAVYCQQLLLTNAGGEDRAQSFYYLQSNFLPGGTIEIADQSGQRI
jgi:spectinomycin phosphotransferase